MKHLFSLVCKVRMLVFALILCLYIVSNGVAGTEFSQLALAHSAGINMNPQMDRNSDAGVDTSIRLLHFLPEVSEAERNALYAELNAELVEWLAPIHVAKVRINDTMRVNSTEAIDGLSSSLLSFIEADGPVYGTFTPNDPDLFDEQKVYSAELLNLFDAWEYTTGSPEVIVAVLDTGIATQHPEFTGRILPGRDFFNDDDEPEDDHGHGTHVGGIVAAAINNNEGAAGICGACSILPIKVLNENNAGTWSSVAAGLIYAADSGADIAVLSLGSTAGTQIIETAIRYATKKGVLIVAASGNANSNMPFYPAAYSNVIGVAATNHDDERWALSNYGDSVDVAAPGHVVYSTFNDLNNSYSGYLFMSGTSMATPHVAGLAGLLLSYNSSLTRNDLERILIESAYDLGDPGWDPYYGYGRIDPVQALSMAGPDPQTASVSGTVWHDVDADGVLSRGETDVLGGVQVQVWNSSRSNKIGETYADEYGVWSIDSLAAGDYQIHVIDSLGMIVTNPGDTSFRLAPGQERSALNIGLVSTLPADAIDKIDVDRNGQVVNISWEVQNPLVSAVVIERAGADGDFITVGQSTVEEPAATGSRKVFNDLLPLNLHKETVFYRFHLLPGNTFLAPIEVEARERRTTVLLPAILQ